MSKKATEFQRKAMSKMYRSKEIFKPLNTGWVDEHVACLATVAITETKKVIIELVIGLYILSAGGSAATAL